MKTTKGNKGSAASGGVDWPEVNRALDFLNKNGLEEFEFAKGDLRIRLKKPGPAPVMGAVAAPAPVAMTAPATAPTGTPVLSTAPAAPAENLHVVKSPIVGTFYAAPNPQSPPYVKVGDRVTAGQVLCIIEAMKLMNEIESDVAGEVVKVLATSASPVEYGEGLFAIRPDGK